MDAESPEIYTIALKPKEENGNLLGMLTLINLGEDDAERVRVHLPPALCASSAFSTLAEDGSEIPLPLEKTEDGIRLLLPIRHLEPVYIIMRR